MSDIKRRADEILDLVMDLPTDERAGVRARECGADGDLRALDGARATAGAGGSGRP